MAIVGDSIVAYETWRVTRNEKILRDIEAYNAVDCRSTAALRDWLLSIRPANLPWFDPTALAPNEAALERQRQDEREREAIEATLMAGAPPEELSFRQLVADLVAFHRREQKPQWWALFDRQGREDEDHIDDADCLGGLELGGLEQEVFSRVGLL